jgi:hypothetical protein
MPAAMSRSGLRQQQELIPMSDNLPVTAGRKEAGLPLLAVANISWS